MIWIRRFVSSGIRRAFAVACLLGGVLWPAQGMSAPVPEGTAVTADSAAKLERAGKRLEAIAAYEQLAKEKPASRKILARKLAILHAEAGNRAKALGWAKEVTKKHPDPQAYLAEIHARLGNHKAADAILQEEISNAKDLRRKVTLLWQLADLQECQGLLKEAEKTLATALASAEGRPEEETASRRLKVFMEKHAPVTDGQ
jgi:tetratricopeptide (TPR) repeat protein